jgi:protein ATS1
MVTVFALGSNGSGQLGIGHKEDVSVPKQVV